MAHETHVVPSSIMNYHEHEARVVTHDELKALPDPESLGPRHHPVRFDFFNDAVNTALANLNLPIAEEEMLIGLGRFDRQPIENGRFAFIKVIAGGNGQNLMFGGLAAIDQSVSLKLAAGNRVNACLNLCLWGEFTVSRKNTRHAIKDIPNRTGRLIEGIVERRGLIEARYEQYRAMELDYDCDRAKALLHAAAARGIIAWSAIPKVEYVWRHGPGDTNDPSLWGFLNGFTGFWGGRIPDAPEGSNITPPKTRTLSPWTLGSKTTELNGLLDTEAGVTIPALEELMREFEEDSEVIETTAVELD